MQASIVNLGALLLQPSQKASYCSVTMPKKNHTASSLTNGQHYKQQHIHVQRRTITVCLNIRDN